MTGARRPPAVRIGARLRAARVGRGLTIDKVATATGLTKGFISRMERDEVSASVASLVALCDVLGIPVGRLFDAPETTLVRAQEGKPINFGGSGAQEHLISPGSERRLQVIHSVIEPLGGGGAQLYALPTEVEFVVVLSGTLEVVLADEVIALGPRDAFTFPGRAAHTWRNPSDTEAAEVLWVLVPGT